MPSFQVQKQLNNTYFSGTRTVHEMSELRTQVMQFIAEKPVAYRLMEDLLMQQGYSRAKIRQTFQDLTGINPLVIYDVNYSKYLKSPSTIPGLTLAWGEAKGGKYDYYFVMPWTYGYAIFGQKGDMQRDEVEFFYTLKEAKEAFIKIAKDPIIYEDIMSVTPNMIRDRIFTKFNSKAYNETFDYINNNERISAPIKQKVVEAMYVQGKLTEEELTDLKGRIQ